MARKKQSGDTRKSSTSKYRKRKKKERDNREVKQELAAKKEVERIHAEAEFAERNFAKRDAPTVCPLCNQPITKKDEKYNVHVITIDRRKVKVHRTCPGERDE